MNFNSSEIKIYPAANRKVDYDYSANLNTEQNITALSNNIVDYPNYIVSGFDINVQTIVEDNVSKDYLTISDGVCVIQGYNIELKTLAGYAKILVLNPSDYSSAQTVNLELNLSTFTILQGNTMTQIDGYDNDDPNNPIYTGISVSLSSSQDSGNNKLSLGIIGYDSVNSQWLTVLSAKGKKIFANNTQMELANTSGLTDNNFNGSFEDWLKNAFIIDDGTIN